MDFLKNNRRFSLKIGEKIAWDILENVEYSENGDEFISIYCFKGGIKITNVAKKYANFDAYEWVNYIENTSNETSEIISELWDCDITLPLEHEDPKEWVSSVPDIKTSTKICAPNGSTWSPYEFYCDVDKFENTKRINHIYVGKTKKYSASGGRSSEKQAPFFNVHKNGKGYILAIGWSGQWNCTISRGADDVTLRSKIEDTHFRLMPNEKIRTSSAVVMSYEGDIIDSQNKWRRLLKKHFSQVGPNGRTTVAPLCIMLWGGLTSDKVIDIVDSIKQNNLPFEYLWMDAAWYGPNTKPSSSVFEGTWGSPKGDWTPSPHIHPNGLRDVSKAVHNAGMKFLLWYEIEASSSVSNTFAEHREYFYERESDGDCGFLLRLEDPVVWKYTYDLLSKHIEEIGIDCYRQDFNMSPLSVWRSADAEDRQGISEIKHITAMYALWDALLEKFPDLIIDNCASGGRRIDIETLRRSIPLWRSDYYCYSNFDMRGAQNHNLTFNRWIPYSGSGTPEDEIDEYSMRTSYTAALAIQSKLISNEESLQILKKYINEYLTVRPYLDEDFYPLTDPSESLDVWCAMQFDRPEKDDGILMVFRRDESPYDTASLALRGISAEHNYLFTDSDGGSFTVNGADICDKGLKLSISEKRKAKIYFYKKLS